jgi:phenylalanyl-tRNA synthetase beta chain
MKASINWLKEFVNFSQEPEKVADVLTMAGLEVEGMEKSEDDVILDISITPNRPDCLSIMGIAREISAILKRPFRYETATIFDEEGVRPLIEVKDGDLCARYSSRIIRGVEVRPSPEWVTKRLESHGFRTSNTIVDITNYVLLETGQPLHAFDLDKLDGGNIVVKKAGSSNKITTLDDVKRELQEDMLLIWDARKPVAIAGVMGGINSEVRESTVNVLLESAFFDPRSIRRTSRALNITTEASYRFERETDIKFTATALDRAVKLITDNAGGRATRITDMYSRPFVPRRISVGVDKINRVIGVDVEPSQIQKILNGLEIENVIEKETEGPGKGRVAVTPPSFRQDIHTDIDVVEEIARLLGYDNIPATLPMVAMRPVHKNTVWSHLRAVRNSMRNSGYSEAINYSFINPESLDALGLPPDDRRRELMGIRNPLKKEEQALRTTLVPALLENVRLNVNRGAGSIRLFEISRTFLHNGQKLPDEVMNLAAVYVKDDRTFVWQSRHDGFFDLKGVVENLFLELGIKKYKFNQSKTARETYLHPGKSCDISLDNQIIGIIGAVHPEVNQRFDINSEILLLELDIEKVFSFLPSGVTFSPLPKYPFVERDLAIVLSSDISVAAAEETILSVASDIIESIHLFDIYVGKPIPDEESCIFNQVQGRGPHPY